MELTTGTENVTRSVNVTEPTDDYVDLHIANKAETSTKLITLDSTMTVTTEMSHLSTETTSTISSTKVKVPSTTSSSKTTTVKKVEVFISSIKAEPTYKILSPKPEMSTAGNSTVGGSNKGLVIGISVGVVLGVFLIAVILLLVYLKKRRKKSNLKEDLMQVENPRYQPATDRSRGLYRFTSNKGGSSPKGSNNNRDSDIEVLATRSSSRKKRRAPPPPNPFGDNEFTGDRRPSQDLDITNEPVELSTFAPKGARLDGEKVEELPEEKPLLSKDRYRENGHDKLESSLANSELVLEDNDHEQVEQHGESEVDRLEEQDEYDKSNNPFEKS